MSKEIYKSIEWEVAAKEAGEGNTENLFIKGRSGNLYNACDMDLGIRELSKRSWYLRCEQEVQKDTMIIERSGFMGEPHVDVCEYRPEVSD